jgi:16S rRNA (cytosine1402-N4)-methyltransferase
MKPPRLPRSSASTDVDHLPVLLGEAVEALAVRPGGVYVDATFGAGGHSRAIAERGGVVVALDVDPDAALPPDLAGRVTLVHGNFGDLAARLTALGLAVVDGVLFDVGVSSRQLDRPERGFSLQHDGPLDMRLNPHEGESAYDVLATRSERELADIIYLYGEERASRRIARAIVALRDAGTPVRDTVDLAGVVARAVRSHGKIHPATRTFQALRIVVNDELGALRDGLSAALDRTVPGGRVAAISFHSLEDRIVKHTFREDPRAHVVTRKPIVAQADELASNPRSRSAKLRVAERAEVES